MVARHTGLDPICGDKGSDTGGQPDMDSKNPGRGRRGSMCMGSWQWPGPQCSTLSGVRSMYSEGASEGTLVPSCVRTVSLEMSDLAWGKMEN